jgi:hypothetical protein
MKPLLPALVLATLAFFAGVFFGARRSNSDPTAAPLASVASRERSTSAAISAEKAAATDRVEKARGRGAEKATRYREYLSSPAGSDLTARKSRIQVKRVYAPFFRRLNLAPDKQDALEKLLIETVSVSRNVYLANVSGEASLAEMQKNAEDRRSAFESQIEGVLGDKFLEYKEFKAFQTERLEIKEISDSAASASGQLSEEQIDALARALDQINASAPELQRSKLTESDESRLARYGILLEDASQILTPEQFKGFSEGIRDRVAIRNARGS